MARAYSPRPNRKKRNAARRRTYLSWYEMVKRCYRPTSPKHAYYGARGITVCDAWRNDFEAFLRDMGYRPEGRYSIDRIDNDKGYSPDNCRWATDEQQQANRSNTRWLTFGGETMCLNQWAKRLRMNFQSLARRIDKGMPIEEALTKPPRRQSNSLYLRRT